jgi:Zn-dependent membrane protease YugP
MLILIGFLMNVAGLAWLGLIFFGFTTMFSILTLPIELDASRRALNMMEKSGLLATRDDRDGARAVLRAAALTYVGAMVISILNFAYYAMLISGMGRRD